MAASGCEWAHSLLRGAHEQRGDRHVPVPGRLALAPRAGAAQSYRARLLGADAPARRAVAAPCAHLSSLSPEATWRHHLRQEPDAVIPLVRIRGGGYEQSSSLLRLSLCVAVSYVTSGRAGEVEDFEDYAASIPESRS